MQQYLCYAGYLQELRHRLPLRGRAESARIRGKLSRRWKKEKNEGANRSKSHIFVCICVLCVCFPSKGIFRFVLYAFVLQSKKNNKTTRT